MNHDGNRHTDPGTPEPLKLFVDEILDEQQRQTLDNAAASVEAVLTLLLQVVSTANSVAVTIDKYLNDLLSDADAELYGTGYTRLSTALHAVEETASEWAAMSCYNAGTSDAVSDLIKTAWLMANNGQHDVPSWVEHLFPADSQPQLTTDTEVQR